MKFAFSTFKLLKFSPFGCSLFSEDVKKDNDISLLELWVIQYTMHFSCWEKTELIRCCQLLTVHTGMGIEWKPIHHKIGERGWECEIDDVTVICWLLHEVCLVLSSIGIWKLYTTPDAKKLSNLSFQFA